MSVWVRRTSFLPQSGKDVFICFPLDPQDSRTIPGTCQALHVYALPELRACRTNVSFRAPASPRPDKCLNESLAWATFFEEFSSPCSHKQARNKIPVLQVPVITIKVASFVLLSRVIMPRVPGEGRGCFCLFLLCQDQTQGPTDTKRALPLSHIPDKRDDFLITGV